MSKTGALIGVAILMSSAATAAPKNTMTDCSKFVDGWKAAYNSKNAEALANMYDASKGMYSNAFWTVSGRAALTQAFTQDFGSGAKMTAITCVESWDDGKVDVSHGTYTATAPGPNGKNIDMSGHWMATSEKKDGKIYILTHNSNLQMPPAAPPAKM